MRILLNGGGNGKKTIDANKIFNKIINHNKPLLYVPLALNSQKYSYENCLKWIIGEMNGITDNIYMVNSFEELKGQKFSDYSAIYIGGGNTYELLNGIKKYEIFDDISHFINKNGIIYGGSAGAIIFGYSINSIKMSDKNDCNLNDCIGFNILNREINCCTLYK